MNNPQTGQGKGNDRHDEVLKLTHGCLNGVYIPNPQDYDLICERVTDMVNEVLDKSDLLQAKLDKAVEALKKMLSPETDWRDGEVGVGFTFRLIAKQALTDLSGEGK